MSEYVVPRNAFLQLNCCIKNLYLQDIDSMPFREYQNAVRASAKIPPSIPMKVFEEAKKLNMLGCAKIAACFIDEGEKKSFRYRNQLPSVPLAIKDWCQKTKNWSALMHSTDSRDLSQIRMLLQTNGIDVLGGNRQLRTKVDKLRKIAESQFTIYSPPVKDTVTKFILSLQQPWTPKTHKYFPIRSRSMVKTILLIRNRKDSFLNPRPVVEKILQLLAER